MIKMFTTLTTLLIVAFPLQAQDTTKPFYFPHRTGDMWEYYYFESNTPYQDTVQNFTISNSIDTDGNIHINQYARSISPIQYPYLFMDTTKYLIDTVSNYVYDITFDTTLVYKLNAHQGDKWVIKPIIGGGYEMARVRIYQDILFGHKMPFMEIGYYGAPDSTDTTGLARYTDIIADEFGLVYRADAEYLGEIHLIGAIINGNLYGDTTIVSVKNKNNIIPSSIKLFQNYPNPFNPNTVIKYEIARTLHVTIRVYNCLGKEITTLVDKSQKPGIHSVIFNSQGLASGVYIYRIITDKWSQADKMLLLK